MMLVCVFFALATFILLGKVGLVSLKLSAVTF